MAGLPGAGDKPFECTGAEEEVRSAIQTAGQHDTDLPALATCLRDPAIRVPRQPDQPPHGQGGFAEGYRFACQ